VTYEFTITVLPKRIHFKNYIEPVTRAMLQKVLTF